MGDVDLYRVLAVAANAVERSSANQAVPEYIDGELTIIAVATAAPFAFALISRNSHGVSESLLCNLFRDEQGWRLLACTCEQQQLDLDHSPIGPDTDYPPHAFLGGVLATRVKGQGEMVIHSQWLRNCALVDALEFDGRQISVNLNGYTIVHWASTVDDIEMPRPVIIGMGAAGETIFEI